MPTQKITFLGAKAALQAHIHLAEDEIPASWPEPQKELFIGYIKTQAVRALYDHLHPDAFERVLLHAQQNRYDLHITLHDSINHLRDGRPYNWNWDAQNAIRGQQCDQNIYASLNMLNPDGTVHMPCGRTSSNHIATINTSADDLKRELVSTDFFHFHTTVIHETAHLLDDIHYLDRCMAYTNNERRISEGRDYVEAYWRDCFHTEIMEKLEKYLLFAPGKAFSEAKKSTLNKIYKKLVDRYERYEMLREQHDPKKRLTQDGFCFPPSVEEYLAECIKQLPSPTPIQVRPRDAINHYMELMEDAYRQHYKFQDNHDISYKFYSDALFTLPGIIAPAKENYFPDQRPVESFPRVMEAITHTWKSGVSSGEGLAAFLMPNLTDFFQEEVYPALHVSNEELKARQSPVVTVSPVSVKGGPQQFNKRE